MNFLAHALLSGDDADILVGNLMTDFLKPGDAQPQNERIQHGIAWHYQIDRFMDSHSLVAQSRRRLFGDYRHYSAVLVDIFYDHLLAVNWKQFSDVPLEEFAQSTYAALALRREMFPPRMAVVMPHLVADNWLCAYARADGVLKALGRVQRRQTRGADLMASWASFEADKPQFKIEFTEFFPQIVTLQREFLRGGAKLRNFI
jgi:acyl carrier protein phosphodiesterase